MDEHFYEVCSDDGTTWESKTGCGETDTCRSGDCRNACELAEQTRSNIGCEFWAVDMPNHKTQLAFAVALSNPNAIHNVTVEIYDAREGAEQLLLSETIGPLEARTIPLSGRSQIGDADIAGIYPGDVAIEGSDISVGGAFRINTSIPIVATQFSPLGGAEGLTTDASLLLPTHALFGEYLHITHGAGYRKATLVAVAVADGTEVNVTPKVALSGSEIIEPTDAGNTVTVNLNRYDYLQLEPDALEVDLSGAEVVASAPIAVFGGHGCASVPDKGTAACDHLEEQLLPVRTWGKQYVAARNPERGGETMLWKILAARDGTTVTFDPPTTIGASTVLNRGEVLEFLEMSDFVVQSDEPIAVMGYMLGCRATNLDCPGDPYMVTMIPVEQYQNNYVFLVDDSYDEDFAKLIRRKGSTVAVDCFGEIPENRWSTVGESGFEIAVVSLNPGEKDCTTGTNSAHGDFPFGLVVSGQSNGASYAYPGGMSLDEIVFE